MACTVNFEQPPSLVSLAGTWGSLCIAEHPTLLTLVLLCDQMYQMLLSRAISIAHSAATSCTALGTELTEVVRE